MEHVARQVDTETTVEPLDGPRAQWLKAVDRSFTVLAFGLACFIPFASWVAASKSYWDLHSMGTTSWDRKKYRVSHGIISVGRYCPVLSLGFVALLLPAMRQIP